MNFLDIIKNQEVKKEKTTIKTGPGKGKKKCNQCESYVGARIKICSCGYNFETKTLGLFAATSEQKNLIERLQINNDNIVQWVLMCSYIYYCKNQSLISDKDYDKIHNLLKENWQNIDHRHKLLIDETSMNNNSLYYLKEQNYPQIVQHSALRLLKAMKKYKTTIENVIEKKLYNLVAFNEMVF